MTPILSDFLSRSRSALALGTRLLVGATLLVPESASAFPLEPALTCQSATNKAAGQSLACRAKAERHYFNRERTNLLRRAEKLAFCLDSFAATWAKIEAKYAVAVPIAGACDSSLNLPALYGLIDGCAGETLAAIFARPVP